MFTVLRSLVSSTVEVSLIKYVHNGSFNELINCSIPRLIFVKGKPSHLLQIWGEAWYSHINVDRLQPISSFLSLIFLLMIPIGCISGVGLCGVCHPETAIFSTLVTFTKLYKRDSDRVAQTTLIFALWSHRNSVNKRLICYRRHFSNTMSWSKIIFFCAISTEIFFQGLFWAYMRPAMRDDVTI